MDRLLHNHDLEHPQSQNILRRRNIESTAQEVEHAEGEIAGCQSREKMLNRLMEMAAKEQWPCKRTKREHWWPCEREHEID